MWSTMQGYTTCIQVPTRTSKINQQDKPIRYTLTQNISSVKKFYELYFAKFKCDESDAAMQKKHSSTQSALIQLACTRTIGLDK